MQDQWIRLFALLGLILFAGKPVWGQPVAPRTVPAVHSNIKIDSTGRFFIEYEGTRYVEAIPDAPFTLDRMRGKVEGTENGLAFDFGTAFDGTLYVGLVPFADYRHPIPVFRQSIPIKEGKAEINVLRFRGRYDMIGWEEAGRGTLGYRVVYEDGLILYDGMIGFRGTGPFEVDVTIVEGPFVSLVNPDGATIWFETNQPVVASVEVNGTRFTDPAPTLRHEIAVTGLEPASSYDYTVHYGENAQSYAFKSAPRPGSRQPFTFSYSSDSRAAVGGGERHIYGTNAYMVKRIMALNVFKDVAFSQFSGDLINGYRNDRGEIDLEYANWKRAVEPFGHYFPIIAGMGNHEAFTHQFPVEGGRNGPSVDRFPYDTESAERVFADHFVNPTNGPVSEDGASYDPDPNNMDFPSYQENVFYYTYDNVAVINLNSDYWYAPSTQAIPLTGGGLHGYIMDQQLAWLETTVQSLEADPNIDHIFVTQHTPFFPNGGHVGDDMWYRGNNDYRPWVAGKPLAKGIIERRDQLLDILVNRSQKMIAILTGDEHNYNRLEISPETTRYPEGYLPEKIQLSRTIYQINNGAAGAPYYAQEETPWTPWVSGFTTQNAVVFFHVEGKRIRMEVLNPDTLEPVDEMILRP